MQSTKPFHIRPATVADSEPVAGLLAAMLQDMERSGGRPVAAIGERLAFFADRARVEIEQTDCRYVVAQADDGSLLGAGNAKIVTPPPVFEPRRSLHISTLYVVPESRRQGIGRKLIDSLLDWGREQGCAEADLNVLMGNPARSLYQHLGFDDFQRKMTREL